MDRNSGALDWTKIWLIICIAGAIATIAMQWGAFATQRYVNDKVELVAIETQKKIEEAKRIENEHYIELLKSMNDIKLILVTKRNIEQKP